MSSTKRQGDATTEDQSESQSQTSTIALPSDQETPSTSLAPSETDSGQPLTPQFKPQPYPPAPAVSVNQPQSPSHTRTITKTVVPVVPIIPRKTQAASPPAVLATSMPINKQEPMIESLARVVDPSTQAAATNIASSTELSPQSSEHTEIAPTTPAKPKSWADLVRTKGSTSRTPELTGANGMSTAEDLIAHKAGSLADALASFAVDAQEKISFIEPRGLVNTGNMCYMNSVNYHTPPCALHILKQT